MRKVCLMGASLDTSNMGVSALAVAFFKLIIATREDTELCLLVGRRAPGLQKINLGDRTCKVNIVNCRMSPRARLQENMLWILLMAAIFRCVPSIRLRTLILKANTWLRNIYDADFIGSIHGGDGFSDIYGLVRFILGVLPDLSVLLIGKELVLLPQTYGPYRHPLAKWLARLIMKQSIKILSRDQEGLQIVRQSIGSLSLHKPVLFCPDMAFVLDPILLDQPNIIPPIQKKPDIPLIGLNVNGLMYNGGYSRSNMFSLRLDYHRFVNQIVRRFLNSTPAHILLVPHTYAFPGSVESDPDACAAIQNQFEKDFPHRVHLVAEKYDQSEIKGIISLCDFFIGSRMHACIGALSQGIPTVGVAYSRKFIGVFQSAGVGNTVVDACQLDEETALERVVAHWVDRERIGRELCYKAGNLRREVWKIFRQLKLNSTGDGRVVTESGSITRDGK